jgi:hypothetical protein
MCLTEYLILFIVSSFAVIFAVAALPTETLVLIGAIIIPAGFAVIGAAIYKFLNQRRLRREMKARYLATEAKYYALKDRRDDLASIRIIGRSLGLEDTAYPFVECCRKIDAARDQIHSSKLVCIDHMERTVLNLMRTAAQHSDHMSDGARAEIESSLRAGTALMEASLSKITLSIEKEVTTSAQALSMQLDRMVKVPS